MILTDWLGALSGPVDVKSFPDIWKTNNNVTKYSQLLFTANMII